MAVGMGLSIGTVNTVSARAEEGAGKAPPGLLLGHRRAAGRAPAVTRRTTLTFDSTGTARVGLIPRHGRAITEFADLGQRAVRARVAHRSLGPADLVALVTDRLVAEARTECGDGLGVALTHPAVYTAEQVARLREALDSIGREDVALVAEPVAAATWLEAEHGPLMPGLTLVYDLGGASLDVTLVRVGAGRPHNPIVGIPLRSADFGGRAFGASVVTRGAGDSSSVDADELRIAHVRSSLELVYRCLGLADVTMADVDRVLVVGGAARPAEVARVLEEELARPVIVARDPERTIADGAALLARRTAEAAEEAAGVRKRRGLLSARRRKPARVAAALAMIASGVGVAIAVPADGVIAGLGALGLF
ncbi:Hsp70 family protein [Nocardia puris]|uniref:Molecular chaperone HscA n=1 Tax=Nocardia puris TaxID=208602 RepID=A0A366DFU1_9NOCA|nr:Hsp70 family protein [Nocardia puris]MBF6212083.1 Hsp70 family protein [Nocardia puris]MBF6367109.1 Hsp70 family protein [Nocardia puris]MBF6461914.1 Hsp70 family protein [Nocardia puris]RBO88369.1 molecular chaperone HscA [Nocardia puris]